MNIEHWSFATGYCKLKTARQQKRLLKKDFDKYLLRLDRQETELFKRRQALTVIPLAEPYQKGWKRTFVLSADVARSNNADFYHTLLKKINTVEYSINKQFTRKRRGKRKKVYEVRPQNLRELYTYEWNHPKCKLTDQEKVHFHIRDCPDKDNETMIQKFVFNEPWRFVLQVKPNMIAHVQMIDEALERSVQHLRNHIESNHLRPAMNRLIRGRSYDPWCGEENKGQENPLKNKPLYKILEAVAQDNL
jgi:hypothetical protein